MPVAIACLIALIPVAFFAAIMTDPLYTPRENLAFMRDGIRLAWRDLKRRVWPPLE